MISRKNIVRKLHKKFGKLQMQSIDDAVGVICDFLSTELIADQAVSVENFGTLSPYITRTHKAFDVARGNFRMVTAQRTVKFRASHHLLVLVRRRRATFLRKLG